MEVAILIGTLVGFLISNAIPDKIANEIVNPTKKVIVGEIHEHDYIPKKYDNYLVILYDDSMSHKLFAKPLVKLQDPLKK